MTVIEQVMFFAACQECDWQSVLRSEAAVVEGMERTHRAHEHPQPSEQEFLSHYAADVTVPQPSEPHVHEFKLRYVCDCGEHSRGQQSNRRCICMPAVAGISDGPNVDCPEHGDGEPPCAMCNDTGWQGADLCPLHGGEAGPYRD